ncbi:Os05g0270850, partial [Oryza sativa Japonica Group]
MPKPEINATNLRPFNSSSVDTPSGADFNLGNTTTGMPLPLACSAPPQPASHIKIPNKSQQFHPNCHPKSSRKQSIVVVIVITWFIGNQRNHNAIHVPTQSGIVDRPE